jgi:DNA-binding NarL/FixJ family response regulator
MKKKILLVEDHDDFRATVKDYLIGQKLDLEIFEAKTGEMGVITASCVKPDIVLMDINLPSKNGIEASRQIMEDQPDCDIIILTLFDVPTFRKTAEKIKIKAYIGKDEVYQKLLPVIKECLCKKSRS